MAIDVIRTLVRRWYILTTAYPANTGHCRCVGSMLAQRRRRWANIEPTHGQCSVFAGYVVTNNIIIHNILFTSFESKC